MNLNQKRVVVIGAGSGIGRAVAVAAAAAGAEIVVCGRTRASLEATGRLTGAAVAIRQVDATIEREVVALFESLGTFDHLVSTIGQGVSGSILEIPTASIERAMGAKLWAPVFLVRHGAPRVETGGSFTFFSGIRGARPSARSAVTSLVNGGLEAFARAMAVELAPIRVNVVSPGVVDSGPFWSGMPEEERSRMFTDFAMRSPARRVGVPEDQAEAVMFAISNAFLTGAVLPVDGGALLM